MLEVSPYLAGILPGAGQLAQHVPLLAGAADAPTCRAMICNGPPLATTAPEAQAVHSLTGGLCNAGGYTLWQRGDHAERDPREEEQEPRQIHR